jgi:hypothetical protein
MAYSKSELKSSSDKASPCFRPFWIGTISDMFTYTDFTIRFDVGLLWTRQWTFGFRKMLGSSWVAAQLAASQRRAQIYEWWWLKSYIAILFYYVPILIVQNRPLHCLCTILLVLQQLVAFLMPSDMFHIPAGTFMIRHRISFHVCNFSS